ncbi:major facilitator superfamily domain-containing protein [Pseudomassariella vexata]|uniref:Major facilitator superfamily domain-containing protein n=1 Tax=Pseudomassariella vexata TaxID=1141098 RepID=A0A1Y2EC65_9PEZI|nr:major facilitator superfamily domain-containing protein [Pseudomassariella vexata]ORY68894.1 major facilitator superfamily domain-containing protein [Pseudomassariella vexata]
MSKFDAAPPNTHAGGDDDALRARGSLPMNATNDADERVNMDSYQRDNPLWSRVYHHSLTQMMLLSVQAFCGPAMADAIAGLGGGGLATPQTSNIATAINYSLLATVCLLGGPIVNKLGVKWSLVVGAMSFPIRGSSYYCNSQFGNQWYLIMGAFFTGIGTGCWYVAESGAIMSLAPSGARGKYLALWIVARNLGQLVGGAINLAKNHRKGAEGGVTPDTYVAFLIIECMALPFALLISPLERVVRSDGTRILVSESLSTKQEFRKIRFTMSSKLILLSALWAIWSFFYSGSWSTYLGTYFSVRSRALSSLISPFFCIVGCFGLGFILDIKSLSQRRRAQLGLFTVVILNLGVYIWSIVMQVRFDESSPGKIDWDAQLYPSAFLPYFFVQTTGPLSQSYMYWLLSSFATDAQSNVRNGAAFRCLEAVGQAISYGMNTQIKTTPLIGFCVTFGLMAAALGPMLVLVNSTPDRIPADVLAEEHEKQMQEKVVHGIPVKAV